MYGAAYVVSGGLVAAVTSVVSSEHGAWTAAYLVLVAGVAQLALGIGQAELAPAMPSRRLVRAELATWNAGSLAVIVGTLADTTVVVDVGGTLLVVGLALFTSAVAGSTAGRGRILLLYRLLAGGLLLSIPVGLLLAR